MKVINCWNPKHRSPRPWCDSLGHMLNRFPQANTVRGCEEKEIYIYSYQSASPLSDWLLTWSQQGWNRGGHVDLVYVSCQAGACLISTALRNKDWVTAVFPPLVMTKILPLEEQRSAMTKARLPCEKRRSYRETRWKWSPREHGGTLYKTSTSKLGIKVFFLVSFILPNKM